MSKLVEVTHVTLGGEVGSTDWAFPYLDHQHSQYAMDLLTTADALLLGRQTYEGLSVAYTRMADEAPDHVPSDFIARMNRIPKFVASTTLTRVKRRVLFGDDLQQRIGHLTAGG
jgi:hypothetical protein